MDDRAARVALLIEREAARPADGDGVMGVLRRLCSAAERALSARGVGISLIADEGARGVSVASDPACERLEELQFVLGEGPCIDAFAARRPVLMPDLGDGATVRWPGYTPAVRAGGVRAVFAFPLQVGAARLGVLDVFRAGTGLLSADEFGEALTFADIALTTLLDGQQRAAAGFAAAGLDQAVGHRAQLFQAQGMVSVQLDASLQEALARMRAYAYAENRSLEEVADDIVARRLRLERDHP